MSGDLHSPAAYARFLRIQLAARAPIEAWMSANASDVPGPPAMAPLLIDDLAALGEPFSLSTAPFAMPVGADPIGAAWALAGSHLGNRAMLADLGERASSLPTSFLGDRSMMAYWQLLLPRLSQPSDEGRAAAAILAAESVFAHFLKAEACDGRRLAA